MKIILNNSKGGVRRSRGLADVPCASSASLAKLAGCLLACSALLLASSTVLCETQSFFAIRDSAPGSFSWDRYSGDRESDLSWFVFRFDEYKGCCKADRLIGSQVLVGPNSPVFVRNELREPTLGLALGLAGIGGYFSKQVHAEINSLALNWVDYFSGEDKLAPIPIDFVFNQINARDSIFVANDEKLSKPLHVRGLILFGSRIVKVVDPKVHEYPITFVLNDPGEARYRYVRGKALFYSRQPRREVEEHRLTGGCSVGKPFESDVRNGETVSNDKYLSGGAAYSRSVQIARVVHGLGVSDSDYSRRGDDHDRRSSQGGRRSEKEHEAHCGNDLTF